ncbi:coiled-coil domain-containing protein 190-like [Bombina bombina]|uniref:coiled-coil domain-containing protein 190-like n=1 Tax=Bombina bombina TaxID=8345 RepID=UPI00235B1CCE|nr:coiled-coil domain-containing protein 190-like [Bombina bombina]
MQRSRLLGSNADKQWEAERRGVKRQEIRLNNGLQELEAAQMYHVNSMTKEQKRIQKDLIKIKQATVPKTASNTRGGNYVPKAGRPTASGSKGQLSNRSTGGGSSGTLTTTGADKASPAALQMRINDFMDGISSLKVNTDPPAASNDEPSASEVVAEAKEKSQKEAPQLAKLEKSASSAHLIPQYSRQRRGSLIKENQTLDVDMYLPNGRLRTMYTMPDLKDSLEEARKARYIRHRGLVESERELTIEEIFQKEDKMAASGKKKANLSQTH